MSATKSNSIQFLRTDQICKDIKGKILSYVPFEYRDEMIIAMKGTVSFIDKHIHHFEPHFEIMEEYDKFTMAKLSECYMVNGQRHGRLRKYYPNGTLWKVIEYKNGLKDGKKTIHRDVLNDQKVCELQSIGNYKNGVLHGVHTSWYANGEMFELEHYVDGKLDGVRKVWSKGGKLKFRDTYSKGNLNGLSESWHRNGQKFHEINYKDGRKHGLATYWLPNRVMSKRTEYVEGKKQGEEMEWDGESKIITIRKYVDGVEKELTYFDHPKVTEKTIIKEDGTIESHRKINTEKIVGVCRANIIPGRINMLDMEGWKVFNIRKNPYVSYGINWADDDVSYVQALFRNYLIGGYQIVYRKDDTIRYCKFYPIELNEHPCF